MICLIPNFHSSLYTIAHEPQEFRPELGGMRFIGSYQAFLDLRNKHGEPRQEFPFRAVIGVELNPRLARVARKNVAHWKAAGLASAPVRVCCGDAVEFELPPGPCVVFMFNPFEAPVMRRLFKRWSRNLRGREGALDILYVNDEQKQVLRRQSGLKRLFSGRIMRSRADAIADHRILANQPDGEYAVTNWEDCSIYRWMGLSSS